MQGPSLGCRPPTIIATVNILDSRAVSRIARMFLSLLQSLMPAQPLGQEGALHAGRQSPPRAAIAPESMAPARLGAPNELVAPSPLHKQERTTVTYIYIDTHIDNF